MPAPLALQSVGNVFYFVHDFDGAIEWYIARLGRQPVVTAEQLVAFDISGVRLTIHKQDDLNSPGPSGIAAYWNVSDVDAIVAEWTKHGAKAHRGPKTVFTGERLCQLLDPFGNIFAIRQPPTPHSDLGDRTIKTGTEPKMLRVTAEAHLKISELITSADAYATDRDAENYVSLFTAHGIMDGIEGDFCGHEAIRSAVLHVWEGEPQGTSHFTTMLRIDAGTEPDTAVAFSTLLVVDCGASRLLASTPIRQEVSFVGNQWLITRRSIG